MEVGTDIQENGSSQPLHQRRTLEMVAIAAIVGVNLGSSLLAGLIGGNLSESNLLSVRVSVPTFC